MDSDTIVVSWAKVDKTREEEGDLLSYFSPFFFPYLPYFLTFSLAFSPTKEKKKGE